MTKISTDERRTQILDTAAKLFIEKGYYETSVSNIVKECGVAQGTFYYYFKTKEEIFDEVVCYVPTILFNKLTEKLNLQKTPKDKIGFMCTNIRLPDCQKCFIPTGRENITASKMKYISGFLTTMTDLFRKMLTKIFTEGVKNGEFEIENINFAVAAALGLFKELFVSKVFEKTDFGSDDDLQKYMRSFFEKLLNTKLQGE